MPQTHRWYYVCLCFGVFCYREENCIYVFIKTPFGSRRNSLMFELSDLHKFIATKAGVSNLDLDFVHKYAQTRLR